MEAELCLLRGRPRDRRRDADEDAALPAAPEAEPVAEELSLPSLRGPYLFLRYLARAEKASTQRRTTRRRQSGSSNSLGLSLFQISSQVRNATLYARQAYSFGRVYLVK